MTEFATACFRQASFSPSERQNGAPRALWGVSGRSWMAFGALLGALGALLGRLGAVLGGSWSLLGRPKIDPKSDPKPDSKTGRIATEKNGPNITHAMVSELDQTRRKTDPGRLEIYRNRF